MHELVGDRARHARGNYGAAWRLQPLVVAVGSFLILDERRSLRGWSGLVIGLAGVALMIAPLLGSGLGTPVPVQVVAASVYSILVMAAGTMVQRGQIAQDGLCVSSTIQNLSGSLVAAGAAVAQADWKWDGSADLLLALGWSVVVFSAAALSLLVWKTRRQGATRVALPPENWTVLRWSSVP